MTNFIPGGDDFGMNFVPKNETKKEENTTKQSVRKYMNVLASNKYKVS